MSTERGHSQCGTLQLHHIPKNRETRTTAWWDTIPRDKGCIRTPPSLDLIPGIPGTSLAPGQRRMVLIPKGSSTSPYPTPFSALRIPILSHPQGTTALPGGGGGSGSATSGAAASGSRLSQGSGTSLYQRGEGGEEPQTAALPSSDSVL